MDADGSKLSSKGKSTYMEIKKQISFTSPLFFDYILNLDLS